MKIMTTNNKFKIETPTSNQHRVECHNAKDAASVNTRLQEGMENRGLLQREEEEEGEQEEEGEGGVTTYYWSWKM